MNVMHFASILSMAVLAAFGPFTATAFAADQNPATRAAPVRIVHCNVFHTKPSQGWIHIGFADSTKRALKWVRFKVDFAGTSRVVNEKGLFSPGIEIHHTYIALHQGTSALAAVCTPIAAQFTDGSMWP